ncbi:hypothetical protein BGY98DRAFT_1180491 [Russula aff. rugulosa BPL654]|nr:hypothetical protein BGY98DRAFT_1180491 [Russula aff. rugulosa BPL654]
MFNDVDSTHLVRGSTGRSGAFGARISTRDTSVRQSAGELLFGVNNIRDNLRVWQRVSIQFSCIVELAPIHDDRWCALVSNKLSIMGESAAMTEESENCVADGGLKERIGHFKGIAASQRLLCAWRAELTSGVGEGILGRGIAGVSVGFVSLWIVVGRRPFLAVQLFSTLSDFLLVNTQAAVKNPTLSGLRKHEEGVPGDHYVKSQYIDPSREFNSAYIPSIQYGDVNLCCKLRALGSGAEPNAVRCGARNTELRSKEDKREIK